MKPWLLVLALFFSVQSFAQQPTRITWDSWGVPHISANTDAELFYAEGWAQMQLHGDLITQLYGRSRGRAAEYWGKKKLQEDMMVHTVWHAPLRGWCDKHRFLSIPVYSSR